MNITQKYKIIQKRNLLSLYRSTACMEISINGPPVKECTPSPPNLTHFLRETLRVYSILAAGFLSNSRLAVLFVLQPRLKVLLHIVKRLEDEHRDFIIVLLPEVQPDNPMSTAHTAAHDAWSTAHTHAHSAGRGSYSGSVCPSGHHLHQGDVRGRS